MIKFIKNIFLFTAVIGIAYIGYIAVFGSFLQGNFNSNLFYKPTTGYNSLRLKEVESIKDIDVLFIGSSHSYRSFDPRILEKYGLKTFNLGSSSQSHIQTNYLLKKYLNQLNPKLVVYEVFPYVFSSDGVESSINLISSSPELNLDLFLMAIQSKNLLVFNNFLHTAILNIKNIKPGDDENNIKDLYIKGGYVERIRDTINTEENTLSTYWSPYKKQLNYYKKNVEIIKRSNSDLLFIQTPYIFKYSNKEEIDDFFAENKNYYNLNCVESLTGSIDFYDPNHLNQSGAEKVTHYIAPVLLDLINKKWK